MQTYPYPTPDGIIDLVRKTEFDRLKWELEEQCAELAKWQALAGQLAERLNLWHNAAGNRCNLKDAEALAAYESVAMDHAETPASTATGR